MGQFPNDPPGEVPGFVYFVERRGIGVKIGSSRNWPTTRIYNTPGLHARDLLLALETHSCRELERALHERLRERRLRKRGPSDTFILGPTDLQRIADGFEAQGYRGLSVTVTRLAAFEVFCRTAQAPYPTALVKRKYQAPGGMVQVTFRLPEEATKRIEAMAAAAGVTKEDMKRWLVLQGMQAWERGERPVLDEEVVRQAVRLEW